MSHTKPSPCSEVEQAILAAAIIAVDVLSPNLKPLRDRRDLADSMAGTIIDAYRAGRLLTVSEGN